MVVAVATFSVAVSSEGVCLVDISDEILNSSSVGVSNGASSDAAVASDVSFKGILSADSAKDVVNSGDSDVAIFCGTGLIVGVFCVVLIADDVLAGIASEQATTLER